MSIDRMIKMDEKKKREKEEYLKKLIMASKDPSVFASLEIHNLEAAFDYAIKMGLKYPDDWMYMYTKKKRDYFKNIDTRTYRSFKHKWKIA
jgi:hypothetical protein